MDRKSLASKLTNWDMPVSNTNRKCQFTWQIEINIYQIIPEMSYIPDQYGNIALMSSLSVLHKDRVKTSLSQQFNKLTRFYNVTNIL